MFPQTILPQVAERTVPRSPRNQHAHQAEELLSTLKELMPTIYQKETLESILGLLLDGQGNAVPHHCQTKSESAISRFLNHYNWSTRSLIKTIRSFILNLILSERGKGRKPILQVILDLTTLEKVGKFPHLKDLVRVYNHKKGLHARCESIYRV